MVCGRRRVAADFHVPSSVVQVSCQSWVWHVGAKWGGRVASAGEIAVSATCAVASGAGFLALREYRGCGDCAAMPRRAFVHWHSIGILRRHSGASMVLLAVAVESVGRRVWCV